MDRQQFEKAKRDSLGHLLIKVGRLYHLQSLRRVRGALALERLTAAHLDLFPYIDFEGSSVVEIAKRKGVSKQAVSRLVGEMLEMGILVSRVHPEDRRSFLVTFATAGRRSIYKGFQLLQELDADLKKLLGEAHYQQAQKSLLAIQDSLEK